MLASYIVSAVFVVSVVALCIAKPNAGRIFLGLFFLAMALGVSSLASLASGLTSEKTLAFAPSKRWPSKD